MIYCLNSGIRLVFTCFVRSQTPLLIACSKGHKECVILLLERGANLNAIANVNGETVTALKLAEKGGHTETVDYIKKCHGKITICHYRFQF